MDELIAKLKAAESADAIDDVLDDIGIACLAKISMAESAGAQTNIRLSDAERHVAVTSNAYSLAMNGGVTEVIARMDVDSLVFSLREMGCGKIADSVERMAVEVQRMDEEIAHLSGDEKHRIYSDLKFKDWKCDDSLYYDPEGGYNMTARAYILERANEFAIAQYAD